MRVSLQLALVSIDVSLQTARLLSGLIHLEIRSSDLVLLNQIIRLAQLTQSSNCCLCPHMTLLLMSCFPILHILVERQFQFPLCLNHLSYNAVDFIECRVLSQILRIIMAMVHQGTQLGAVNRGGRGCVKELNRRIVYVVLLLQFLLHFLLFLDVLLVFVQCC